MPLELCSGKRCVIVLKNIDHLLEVRVLVDVYLVPFLVNADCPDSKISHPLLYSDQFVSLDWMKTVMEEEKQLTEVEVDL